MTGMIGMRGKKNYYNCINITVLVFAAAVFVSGIGWKAQMFRKESAPSVFVFILSVVSVHAIKAVRLYLALYGTGISWTSFLKAYCKVTPVSVSLPFKIGEIFRMYCYGHEIKNGLRGTIIILLDRFMDTLALVTIILVICFFNHGTISQVVYVLILFLAVLLITYYVFPGIYTFWKQFLLSVKATERRLGCLKILEKLRIVQDEISGVTRGRGALLYALSLIAWAVELGSIALISGYEGNRNAETVISNYLSAALGIDKSAELQHFVFYSVFILAAVYLLLKLVQKSKQQGR